MQGDTATKESFQLTNHVEVIYTFSALPVSYDSDKDVYDMN
jgi:hypothetical protein